MQGMGLVVICFFCGLSAGFIGRWKGSSFWLWFAIGFFLPVLGTIAALAWRYLPHPRLEPRPDTGP